MKVEKRLLQLKQDIEDFKIKKAHAEGAIKQLMQELEESFGCSTMAELRARLKKTREQMEQVEAKVEAKVEELERKYDNE